MTGALLALLLMPVVSTGPVHGPISLRSYQQAVHAVRLSLDRARLSPNAAIVRDAQQELHALATVRMPGGHVITTDLPMLAVQLRASDRHSVEHVTRVMDALDDSLGASLHRAASASQLRALDAILRESQFHPVRPPWAPLLDWLQALHDRFIEWLSGSVSSNSPTSLIFAGLLVFLVASVGYLVARGALSRLVVERAPPSKSAVPTTSQGAEERAAGEAAAGNYREALRYLFLATMLALQERGAIELRPGVTNQEYLRRLQDTGIPASVEGPLGELVDSFDAVWYGHSTIDAAEFLRCQDLSRRVLAGASRAAA